MQMDYGALTLKYEETLDWREPIIQHLKYPMELSNFNFHEELGILRDGVPNYFLKEGELKERLANGDNKLCISRKELIEWLTKIHKQRDSHFSMDEITTQVTKGPYWWPTIPPDIDQLCKECRVCWLTKPPEHVIGCTTIAIKEKEGQDWRTPYIYYLKHGRLTIEASTTQ